ncbi:MAG: chemotaxis protein MotA [Phenylobacterium sp.]|jgi:chemotaxis protein MotA
MDKGTSLGFLLLIVAIIGGIISSNVGLIAFINMPSIFIVVVGTFGAVMVSHRLNVFIDALTNISKAFTVPTMNPTETIDQLIEMANLARAGGYLALEDVDTQDPFIRKAVNLLIDGHDVDAIDHALSSEIYLTKERNNASIKVLNSFTETAPSMGMVGTLIGLVAMLLAMDDPKTIGKSMSVALLTTLYGALIAYGITGPLARKLGERSTEIRLHQSMIKDGFLRIANGENPKAIFEFMQSYLDERNRRPLTAITELLSPNK